MGSRSPSFFVWKNGEKVRFVRNISMIVNGGRVQGLFFLHDFILICAAIPSVVDLSEATSIPIFERSVVLYNGFALFYIIYEKNC